jgi:hypothetical protein
MSFDLTELGQTAVEMFETLEHLYGELPNVEVGIVAVVAEVTWGDADEQVTSVSYRCSDPRRWIQQGLFAAAVQAVGDSAERPDNEG